MILIALAFVAAGYPLAYWGANNLKHWNRSIQTTEAAPMSLLYGVGSAQALRDADKLPIHPVPFPYTSTATKTTGAPTPSSGTGGNGGNSGGLSPNYPGGPNGTIPTPPVPGGQSV